MEDKVILITGASSGIGKGAAEHLAKIGYRRLSIVARREAKLEEVASTCRQHGAKDVLVLPIDLSAWNDAREAVQQTINYFKRTSIIRILLYMQFNPTFFYTKGLDILICSAGVIPKAIRCPTSDLSYEAFDQTMALNFSCPVAMTIEAIPSLRKTKGNILYISGNGGKPKPLYSITPQNAWNFHPTQATNPCPT